MLRRKDATVTQLMTLPARLLTLSMPLLLLPFFGSGFVPTDAMAALDAYLAERRAEFAKELRTKRRTSPCGAAVRAPPAAACCRGRSI